MHDTVTKLMSDSKLGDTPIVYQMRYIASRDMRIRAWSAGVPKSEYIITRQFFSPSANYWVTEPLSY